MTGDEDLKSTATRNLFERLRQEILTGQLPYGTQLRQAEVAARFGMSTTPVREALRELAALGLVVIHQHRGAIVHRPSAHELSHIYETRMLLEPTSVAWSAPLITSEAIEEARKLIEEMREVTTPARRRRHEPPVSFPHHRRVRERLAAAMTINLLDLSTPYLVWFRENTVQEFARQAAEHEDILRACEERDPAAAFRASMRHLTRLHLAEDGGEQGGAEDRWLPFDMTAFMEDDPGQHP